MPTMPVFVPSNRVTYGVSKCQRAYPIVGSRVKKVADLKTMAQGYTKAQLQDHIENLQKALREMPDDGIVDVTVFRNSKRVTVTSRDTIGLNALSGSESVALRGAGITP